MATKQKLKKQDRNIIIFAVVGFVALIIAGFAVVGGVIGYLVGNLNENLNNPPDAEKLWEENKGNYALWTRLVQKYYNTKIVDRKTDIEKKTDSIKLSTSQGWDFWYYCKKGLNFGSDCYYRSSNSGENYTFGKLLYEMNQDIIAELADKYGGQKTKPYTYGFSTEEYKKAFAEEVAKIVTIEPTVEICKEIRKEKGNFSCLSVTPITIDDNPKYTDTVTEKDIYSFL